MAWQQGKRKNHGSPVIRNALQDKMVLEALKAENVPPTPQNKDRVHQAIAGTKPTHSELAGIVHTLFNSETPVSAD